MLLTTVIVDHPQSQLWIILNYSYNAVAVSNRLAFTYVYVQILKLQLYLQQIALPFTLCTKAKRA